MIMEKCSFCSIDINAGTGKMYVKKDGKILHFCSRKCEKNMLQMGRKPAKYKWASKPKNLVSSEVDAMPEPKPELEQKKEKVVDSQAVAKEADKKEPEKPESSTSASATASEAKQDKDSEKTAKTQKLAKTQ